MLCFIKCTIYFTLITIINCQQKKTCLNAFICSHNGRRLCGLDKTNNEIRWFLDYCDMLEFNCEYKRVLMLCSFVTFGMCHGPPRERDNEDVIMGRKMGSKWCGMAKMCNHDRVPVCGVSHAGDVMGFRDLCDMFDFNCIRRRNYKQTNCPGDRSMLTASRKPIAYYED